MHSIKTAKWLAEQMEKTPCNYQQVVYEKAINNLYNCSK